MLRKETQTYCYDHICYFHHDDKTRKKRGKGEHRCTITRDLYSFEELFFCVCVHHLLYHCMNCFLLLLLLFGWFIITATIKEMENDNARQSKPRTRKTHCIISGTSSTRIELNQQDYNIHYILWGVERCFLFFSMHHRCCSR